jgi:hypothetical protein
MQKSALTVALVFCFAVCAASCTPPPPQDFRLCPPSFQSQVLQFNLIPLDSYIGSDHVLRVGNASSVAIPQGTRIFFTAKLVNAGPYCATVLAPEPILPHLYVRIVGQPLFDDQARSQAWRIAPLVNQ